MYSAPLNGAPLNGVPEKPASVKLLNRSAIALRRSAQCSRASLANEVDREAQLAQQAQLYILTLYRVYKTLFDTM